MMEPSERDRFLHTLPTDEVFRAAVRRELLIDELLALPETVARMAAQLDALTVRLDTLIDVVAAQRRDFTDLVVQVQAYMQRTIDTVGAGFAAVGARFESVDARLDSVGARLDALDAKLDAKFAQVDAGFTAIDARFDEVDAEIADFKRRIA
ncbi:MAG: hypothetical protein ACRDYY_12705 [Acidimicrobiales bacterium]